MLDLFVAKIQLILTYNLSFVFFSGKVIGYHQNINFNIIFPLKRNYF